MEPPAVSVWCGDVNAHNELWDPFLQHDRRGDDVLAERGLISLNDGSGTRYDRTERQDAEGKSAPDVSIVRMGESKKVTWKVEETMSSNHIPIFMTWSAW